ncbi:hypothetical protein [uncultured Acetatifactor sp.]|uniref:hypothetical protein n=1 Tax=uncultured Acetatifactor sp. TaxID=1671927 RepID=UPI0026060ADE|nr:hypothetical protein [uncultured Acetatifactor sp.]
MKEEVSVTGLFQAACPGCSRLPWKYILCAKVWKPAPNRHGSGLFHAQARAEEEFSKTIFRKVEEK